MKALAALVAVAAVAAVVAMVVAISDRDQTGLDLRTCALTEAEAEPVRDVESRRQIRTDLQRSTLRERETFALRGGTWATLLRPDDRLYLVLVVIRGARPQPGVALRRLTDEPGTLPLAAYAASRGVERRLLTCVEAARA